MSELLKVCALAASALLWAAVAVAWAARHGAFASAWRDWRACPRARKALAGIAVVAVVAWAGVKPNENETTDSHGFTRIEERESATPVGGPAALNTENEEGRRRGEDGEVLDRIGESGAPSPSNPVNPVEESPCLPSSNNSMFSDSNSTTPGYILSRVGTNEAFPFDPPEGAVIAESWRRRGAASDWRRLSFDGWEFPFGGTAFSDLVVFANGTILFSANAALRPLTATLGLVPEGGSGGLVGAPSGSGVPTSQTSLFWHVLTPSNTLQLTWHNALLHRSPTNPVSFQVELFPSGNFAFRYDLSALASDGLLTNALAAADSGFPGGETHQVLSRGTTSLTFRSDNERRCDDARDAFDKALGGLDPLAYPSGSTNTVWEHLVYTGMTNGVFAYPQSTERTAVLRVSVAGAGRGELLVGDRAVLLVGPGGKATDFTDLRGLGEGASTNLHESTQISIRENPFQFADETTVEGSASPNAVQTHRALVVPCGLSAPDGPFLLLPVPRDVTVPLYLRASGSLSVSLSSADFAFGRLPDLAVLRPTGRINFPNASATVPCFHDYRARRKEVTLPVGADTESLACTWAAPDSVAVENRPPRAALLTGNFDGRTTTPVTYTLAHPDYLFGQTTFTQTARFCPLPPVEEKEDPSVGRHYGSRDEDDEDESCWHCVWELCSRGCDCCPWCHCGEEQGSERPGGASEEEEPQPGDYETAVTNWPHLSDVLKIREPPLYADPIRLEVPDAGAPRCCPCPDHATNWVAVAYLSDRLKVVDESGLDFRRAAETVDVRLAGVRPSRAVGDAFVSLATNGAVRLDGAYTVLGVGVRSPGVDLVVLDSLNADFGLPIPVATNAAEAAALDLVTDVGLPGGNVRVGFEGASAPFALWVWDSASNAYRPLASSNGGPLDISLAAWRRLVGGATDAATARTRVAVTASASGAATLVFRYWGVFGGRFVEDVARQRLTAVAPPIMVDFNRDGRIDGEDVALCLAGRPYRFWTNPLNLNSVGGESGRLNLFPVSVDVTPFRRAWGRAAEIRLLADECFRYCLLDGVTVERASAVWADDEQTADGAALADAPLSPFTDGELDVSRLRSGSVMALTVRSRVSYWTSPVVSVSVGGAEVYRFRLPMDLRPVREMYRYFSVRGFCGDTRGIDVREGVPSGLPDEETDGRHFVFVHGYNVNPDDARVWADAMFKRLLLAGSQSMFTAVTWFGDYAQVWKGVPVVGGNSLNYYRNVKHAFVSAAPFRAVVDGLPGRKVLLAHSLGNMLVSSAIVDRNLVGYERYHMLNAAVPMEAYDDEAQTDSMVDGAWSDVPQFRASRWHEWFASPDFRAGLTWKGRFGVIPRTENCYSATEDVLANPSADGIGEAWGAQELLKGTTVLYGTDLLLQNVAVEGGWGINARYVANPLAYIPGVGLRTGYFEGYTREQAIAQPLFTSFDDSRMASTNALDFADEDLRAKMLGDAIPAESFAAGRNALDGFANYEYLEKAKHGWPNEKNKKWRHSDIKNVDYRYVQDFFKHIKEATEQ